MDDGRPPDAAGAAAAAAVAGAPSVHAAIDTGPARAPNRAMMMGAIMLAMIMTVLDQTIANVALPHMAGSVSASADQITWVLTSYIIAAAIMTPTTGWLAGRFGRKQVFVVSIVGFTLASALCGAAQNLEQIVLFRVLQGAFGAAMAPLSQAVMLDAYPLEQRGPIMAIWGMGIMIAPICGPILGGWLTDNFSWRWVFYINLPVGVLSVLGVTAFLHEEQRPQKLRFDAIGFGFLSVALGAFQLFLDRGQNNDWFQSPETCIEAAVAGLSLVLFIIHSATTERPFLPIALLGDRNFVAATILGLAVGLLVFSVLALLPPMTQTLLGYPVLTAGLISAPRGFGSLISMALAGRFVGRVDTRLLIITGLSMFAISFWGMSHFALNMDSWSIVWTGFVQGLGMGLVFTPMSVLAFATLAPNLRTDGTGVFTLVRNLGNSAGISIMQVALIQNMARVHSRLTESAVPTNPNLPPGTLSSLGPSGMGPIGIPPAGLAPPGAIAGLNGQVTQQASMVGYVDVFHLMFLTTLAAIPLVLILRNPKGPPPTAHEPLAAD
ncbi:MAG TPA: DHA2 family efflux MFS transporter permease subunit [Caulobacteraceae bacterium]|nr:DHA2 family efflux MFS transporter permease subunit [Caulobacteraceae bacterium]